MKKFCGLRLNVAGNSSVIAFLPHTDTTHANGLDLTVKSVKAITGSERGSQVRHQRPPAVKRAPPSRDVSMRLPAIDLDWTLVQLAIKEVVEAKSSGIVILDLWRKR